MDKKYIKPVVLVVLFLSSFIGWVLTLHLLLLFLWPIFMGLLFLYYA